MPVAATQHTADGAKAFAEFFIRTIDWGFATVSGRYIAHFESDNCGSCTTLSDGIAHDKAAGNSYSGGRIFLEKSQLKRASESGLAYTVEVGYRVTAFEKRSKSGHFITGTAAQSDHSFEVSLQWMQGHWVVQNLEIRT